jgi:hypothetical protein
MFMPRTRTTHMRAFPPCALLAISIFCGKRTNAAPNGKAQTSKRANHLDKLLQNDFRAMAPRSPTARALIKQRVGTPEP